MRKTVVGLAAAAIAVTTMVVATSSASNYDAPSARSALMRNRAFAIALIRGSYPHGLSISLVTLGGRERTLLRARGDISEHAWAAKGTRLLFGTGRSPYRFELLTDGTLRELNDSDVCFSSPDPAPDGTMVRCGDSGGYTLHVPGRPDVFVPDIDENVAVCCPALSRDGKFLASVSWAEVDPPSFDVGITATRRCGRCGGSTVAPQELWSKSHLTWSPSGKQLAFAAHRNRDPLWRSETDVMRGANNAVIIVDTRAHVVARIPNASDPTWAPDGKRIAFASQRTGRWHVYVANADGTHIHQLTHGRHAAWHPSWR